MVLTPGTRLGPYEVVSVIGAGGMGEVYRATDTRLKRQVAIKILPASFAADPDRLARFQREAEVLASLNHPNIAGIHGLEANGSATALVMELVEGDNLAQRLAHGAIPIDEALPIARQIADALEAAHEQGIVHRDLKPANIKVRSDGTVKVLDFGLAKAMDRGPGSEDRGPWTADPNNSPTITTPAMTQAGITRRTREIGISAALGAAPRRLIASVLGRAIAQITAGLLAGAVPSAVIMLYGADPAAGMRLTSGVAATSAVCAFVLLVAALSCTAPLRRALRIDPTQALRADA